MAESAITIDSDIPDMSKGGDKTFIFFVNTEFHFENNSWTWKNGAVINANEWLNIEGKRPIYPIIPSKVLFSFRLLI